MKTMKAKTVSELMALLSTLPPDTRIFQKGDMGDHVEGVTLSKKKLAKYKKFENYYGDMSDPVWRTTKNSFFPEFTVIIVE